MIKRKKENDSNQLESIPRAEQEYKCRNERRETVPHSSVRFPWCWATWRTSRARFRSLPSRWARWARWWPTGWNPAASPDQPTVCCSSPPDRCTISGRLSNAGCRWRTLHRGICSIFFLRNNNNSNNNNSNQNEWRLINTNNKLPPQRQGCNGRIWRSGNGSYLHCDAFLYVGLELFDHLMFRVVWLQFELDAGQVTAVAWFFDLILQFQMNWTIRLFHGSHKQANPFKIN